MGSCSKDTESETSDSPQTVDQEEEEPSTVIASFITTNDFDLPSQNSDGFTILTPSSDSKIVYVDSNSGNDTTGEVYDSNAQEIGQNMLMPTTSIKPFASIDAAKSNMRNDAPDIMLLAAGGVWDVGLTVTRGRSNEERSIYAAYGSGSRPLLRTGDGRGILNKQISNTIISGIKFWAHTRDDEGPYFENQEGSDGFNFYTRDDAAIENVLIEDCMFRSYKNNVLTGATDATRLPFDKFVMRRNIISRNYATNGQGHSQGIYYNGEGASGGTSVLLEENIFDHNGWRLQSYSPGQDATDGQATYFNHNTYFANAKGVLFYGNIFLRASSIGTKWTANNGESSAQDIAIIDNLFIDGELGISMGGNNPGAYRFKDILISNNVLLNVGESRPTNRNLAWNISASDWDGGTISENLILHQENDQVTSTYGIALSSSTAMRDVFVSKNIIYGLSGASDKNRGLLIANGSGNATNIDITENYLHNSESSGLITFNNQDGFFFSGNFYNSSRVQEWFGVEEVWQNFDTWLEEIENDAEVFDTDIWANPERDIEMYTSTLGLGNTKQKFIDQLYLQSRANWNPALTAPFINRWIREGFAR
ncbi:hypothetical protein GCM10022393_25440 [Aquimarina addita]|uniref:Right handed beta helix domain-containing protein n=2 Tax=Aquimarina addita TaxID=870485 RepID=A0ABP6UKU4_9FLAO